MNKSIGLLIFLFAGSANSGTISGGSDLLTPASHSQIEAWHGGSLDLTNIFDKVLGDTSYDFHAAVDGVGPTLTLIEIINNGAPMVVGGYAPESWHSGTGYNNVDSAVSESFLFNIDNNNYYGRTTRNDRENYSRQSYGPTFGAGHDLHVNSALLFGYSNIGNSYGDMALYQDPAYVTGFTGFPYIGVHNLTFGQIEVFSAAAAVPAPTSIILLGLSLLGFGISRRKPTKV